MASWTAGDDTPGSPMVQSTREISGDYLVGMHCVAVACFSAVARDIVLYGANLRAMLGSATRGRGFNRR